MEGPIPTCGGWSVSSLNLNTWQYIKLEALEKVIISSKAVKKLGRGLYKVL